jgi:hypothetical protein
MTAAGDTDGDGLSDLYELQHRSDPARFDTDGDGLDDHAETRLGTDPTRKDTDGDGLTDKEEVDGWEFVYAVDAGGNPIRTWVTSDPLDPDTDGDGLSDFKEKAFGLNPRVVSDPNVLGLEARVAEVGVTHNPNDLIVRGGDTLRYTATVENKLDNRFAQGLFSLNSSAPTVLNTAGVPPVQFVLPPRAQTTMSGTLSVPLTSASQPVSLTQVAGALIADWRQQSNFAEMWLRLEEKAPPPRSLWTAAAACRRTPLPAPAPPARPAALPATWAVACALTAQMIAWSFQIRPALTLARAAWRLRCGSTRATQRAAPCSVGATRKTLWRFTWITPRSRLM